jgi:SpoIID/LytB domain protein
MSRLRRALVPVLALLLGAGVLAGSASTSASAAPGDVTITGHGYGHGRGLSQWGAYGYAVTHGWNHLNILSHYYSNASLGDIGNPMISVRLSAQDNVATQVYSGQAFLAGGYLIQPGTIAQISRQGDGTWLLSTRYGCNGGVGGTATITDPAFRPVSDPGNDVSRMLSICAQASRSYRGGFVITWDGGALRTVNYLGMQDYLRGVVPRESPASWGDAGGGRGMNALLAQAVAARSYAQAENRSSLFKTCDTTSCQVYGGAGLNGSRIEDARTDHAVAFTTGQVMMLGGRVARTEFTSSSGGYTAGGEFPAVHDLGDDASPFHNWSTVVSSAAISSAFGVGTLQSITVLSRNGLGADGGRVTKVRVRGAQRTLDVSGDSFRSALGLRSDWFSISGIAAQPIYSGDPTHINLSPSSVSAVRTGAGSVIAFVRGMDNALWSAVSVNGVFDAFAPIPGGALAGPASVSWDGSRIDLFVVGGNSELMHTWTTVDGTGRPTTWAPYESLGGVLTSAPAAASNGSGNLIVTGRDLSGGTAYRTYTGGTWSPWKSAGGASVVAPQAEVYDGAQYRLRVVGTDGDVWTRLVQSDGADATADWVSTGRASTLAPTVSGTTWWARDVRAAAWPNGQNGIRQEREATSTSVDLGGVPTSTVAMVELGDGHFWTFTRGLDNALWLNIATPSGGTSAWYKVGGYLT